MATLHEAQKDYINRWKKNAEQHFKDGDYEYRGQTPLRKG